MAKTPIYTRDDFLRAFLSLLPSGRAWPKDPDSNLSKTVAALIEPYALSSARAGDLVSDAFPASTIDLLTDWEATLGLPDPCQGQAPTLQARRNQVVARFASTGSQSIPHLIKFAADLGYTIAIEEFWPTEVGKVRAGHALVADGSQFVIRITSNVDNSAVLFRVGESTAGEHLLTFGNDVLECELEAVRPAHVTPVFAYTQTQYPVVESVITLNTQPASYRVFQRSTTALNTFSRGGGPVTFNMNLNNNTSVLEYRLRDFDSQGTTLQNWTSLGSKPSGTQNVLMIVPAHNKWFKLDFRTNGDDSKIVSTTNRWGVGDVWLHGGQSLQCNNVMGIGQGQNQNANTLGLAAVPMGATYCFTDNYEGVTTQAWRALNPTGNNFQPSSPYLAQFLGQMVSTAGVVSAVAGYCFGATQVAEWDEATDPKMAAAIQLFQEVEMAAGYCWFLSHTDAWEGVSKANHKSRLTNHWNLVKQNISFPLGARIDVVPHGAHANSDPFWGTGPMIEEIRQAQIEWVLENTSERGFAYTWPDASIPIDLIHQDAAAARLMGARYALTAQKRLGVRANDARGPYLVSATRAAGSGDIVATVNLNGATALAKRNSGIAVDGLTVVENASGASWPITSVNIGTPSGGTVPVTINVTQTATSTGRSATKPTGTLTAVKTGQYSAMSALFAFGTAGATTVSNLAGSGTATLGSAASIATDAIGTYFNGVSNVNSFATSTLSATALGIGGSSTRTVFARIKPNANTSAGVNEGTLFSIGGMGADGASYAFRQYNDGGGNNVVGDFYFATGGFGNVAPIPGVHTVVMTYTGTTASLYIDGVLAGSETVSINTSNDTTLLIGRALFDPAAHFSWNGAIYELGVIPGVAWTSTQVSAYDTNPVAMLSGAASATIPANNVALRVGYRVGIDSNNTTAVDNLIYSTDTVPGSTLGLPLADNALAVIAPAPTP